MVFWNLRVAQGVLARCAVQFTSSRSPFWNVRVAQADMARHAEEISNQNVHNGYLRVAQGIWRGAPAWGFEEIKAF
ncbi:hypothetical protein A2U01_0068670 [Trifolium medium]|uniref:Uncharacterized protein n=1 Tax=Trifolium medium TaxID=97028 RepID=A0A392SEV5_9FABA|nr:hypothetical protein [Trifolium medium]